MTPRRDEFLFVFNLMSLRKNHDTVQKLVPGRDKSGMRVCGVIWRELGSVKSHTDVDDSETDGIYFSVWAQVVHMTEPFCFIYCLQLWKEDTNMSRAECLKELKIFLCVCVFSGTQKRAASLKPRGEKSVIVCVQGSVW